MSFFKRLFGSKPVKTTQQVKNDTNEYEEDNSDYYDVPYTDAKGVTHESQHAYDMIMGAERYLQDEEMLRARLIAVTKNMNVDLNELLKSVIYLHSQGSDTMNSFYNVLRTIVFYHTETPDIPDSPITYEYCVAFIRYTELVGLMDTPNAILLNDVLHQRAPLTSRFIESK